MSEPGFTHLDDQGRAHMVDVSGKPSSARRAVAAGFVALAPATLAALGSGSVAKGDALAVARIAAIQGAKQASALIPLCHPVRLDQVAVELRLEADGVHIEVEACAVDRTGVEMEALCAVASGALALYDMVKGVDRAAEIRTIRLLEKSGGRSGAWRRRE